MKKIVYLPLLTALIVAGCNDAGSLKSNITGSLGEVMIVMTDKTKTSEGGKYLLEMFRQEMTGLPQVESLFSVSVIPPNALSDVMKMFRNIVIINISPNIEQEGVKYLTDNAWAKDQALMFIEAHDLESFREIVEHYEIKILSFFVSAERKRILSFHTKNRNIELMQQVNSTMGINMVIPGGFRAAKPKSGINFKWFSNEAPAYSEGLLIYTFDYIDENSFSKENLIFKRDSALKENIQGSFEGSYMATETNFPISYKTLTVNGHETAELRGLWKTEGDFMGGPFVQFAHLDKINKRIIITEGYVYAPQKLNKRNHVWQVESLLYSVKFPTN
ncbi:MAG: DUF4837 family protein [Marinilabiliaceae bacterium]|nr:DUF4837 family protein [Marinilabiliaceae bacterium]